jgi:hypothetical protein
VPLIFSLLICENEVSPTFTDYKWAYISLLPFTFMPNGGSAISGNIATKRMFFIIKKKRKKEKVPCLSKRCIADYEKTIQQYLSKIYIAEYCSDNKLYIQRA